jgi:long-chain acyl-CoA synthetase
VQLAAGAPSTVLDDILASAAARLADYKLPESLRIVREIPRNALGKMDRRLLLEMVLEPDSRAVSIR